MPGPGILTGGQRTEIFQTNASARAPQPQGIFAANPGSTSKYTFNAPGRTRDGEYRETMSRLFIEIPSDPPGLQSAFLASVSEEARPLAKALLSGSGSGGAGGTGFVDFLLTEAQEGFAEKLQIADTLTDNYVAYFSGREPVMANYGGTLLNTYQDDQRVWFFRLYDEILRGTQLAARGLIVRLRYDSFLVSGYLLNLNMFLDGDTERTASRFSFQMLVKRLQVMTPALASPTQMPTAGGTGAEAGGVYDQREGTTMPESPPTAVDGPAAEPLQAGATISTREQLLAQGKTEAEINDVLAKQAAMRTTSAVDIREEAVVALQQGLNRITEDAVTKLSKNEANITAPIMEYQEPANTNSVTEVALVKTSGQRRRGGA